MKLASSSSASESSAVLGLKPTPSPTSAEKALFSIPKSFGGCGAIFESIQTIKKERSSAESLLFVAAIGFLYIAPWSSIALGGLVCFFLLKTLETTSVSRAFDAFAALKAREYLVDLEKRHNLYLDHFGATEGGRTPTHPKLTPEIIAFLRERNAELKDAILVADKTARSSQALAAVDGATDIQSLLVRAGLVPESLDVNDFDDKALASMGISVLDKRPGSM